MFNTVKHALALRDALSAGFAAPGLNYSFSSPRLVLVLVVVLVLDSVGCRALKEPDFPGTICSGSLRARYRQSRGRGRRRYALARPGKV